MELQIGQLSTAPFPPASAEVKQLEPRRGYYRLEMLLRDGSGQYLSKNITADQLAQIRVLGRNPVALTDNAGDFFFLIQAHRLRLAMENKIRLEHSLTVAEPRIRGAAAVVPLVKPEPFSQPRGQAGPAADG